MPPSGNGTLNAPPAPVKIERMNTDKTRRQLGSETIYNVYFGLSAAPLPEWRAIFRDGWVATGLPHHVDLEQSFLVVRCQLPEVAPLILPALKKVIAETNAAYTLFAQKEASALEHQEAVWKRERERVEATAAALTFE